MKAGDKDRLSQPYPNNTRPGEKLPDALNLKVAHLRKLSEEFLRDLSPDKHGITWLDEQPIPPKRRVLMSDYVLCAARAVEQNLVEARLHQLELAHSLEALDRLNEDVVEAWPDGSLVPMMKGPGCALDELAGEFVTVHFAGLVRTLCSAFDCLSAPTYFVFATPVDLRRADWGKIDLLRKQNLPPNVSALRDEAIAIFASNADWFSWLDQYRNMVVHRGRRMQFHKWDPSVLKIVKEDKTPFVRTRVIAMLPRDPDLSDMEAFRAFRGRDINLSQTLDSLAPQVVEKANTMAEELADVLMRVLALRRAQPSLLVHPAKQWQPKGKQSAFNGFLQNVTFNPKQITSSPDFSNRLKSAALDTDSSKVWDSWDQQDPDEPPNTP